MAETVCVLCSNNCGVEVRLEGRTIARARGNKVHGTSKGYTCEKALRIDHCQNARSRLTSPMKRQADGLAALGAVLVEEGLVAAAWLADNAVVGVGEGGHGLNPVDAATLGVSSGSHVRVATPGGTAAAVAVAEVTDTMMAGHVALPNGFGLGYSPAGGDPELTGVAPNGLTATDWCDPIARTPWHKHIPARLEVVAP